MNSLADRRRPLDRLEAQVVRLWLAHPDRESKPLVDALRYAIAFARMVAVRNVDGTDVEVDHFTAPLAAFVRQSVEPRLAGADTVFAGARDLPEILRRVRAARAAILARGNLHRDALEAEVTTRLLAVASGGGGGAGYVYPGAYELLERNGLCPDLMTGTSIGALMALFRARRKRWDFAPLVAAARELAWGRVFRVLESESRYGIPATLRLYLQAALGKLFRHESGRAFQLSDMEIPLYIVATGLTVDALKHDLNYYEHFLDPDVSGGRLGFRSGLKVISMLREFLSRPDNLVQLVLGRDAGTVDFDAIDAAGFSAAIPGIIHYDVLRDDPRMKRLLDALYAQYGITRLGEGGLVSNVPARIAWESIASGRLGRRSAFVLALDCFAPNPRRLAWLPFQQMVRAGNVEADREFADLYVPFYETLSPMNLVPPVRDALTAIRWGRDTIRPQMPFVVEMMRKLPVLHDA